MSKVLPRTDDERREWIAERAEAYPHIITVPILKSRPRPDQLKDHGIESHCSIPWPDRTRTYMFASPDDLERFMELMTE